MTLGETYQPINNTKFQIPDFSNENEIEFVKNSNLETGNAISTNNNNNKKYKYCLIVTSLVLYYLVILQLTGGFIGSSIYIASKYDNESKVVECPTECYGYPTNLANSTLDYYKYVSVYCGNTSIGYYTNSRHMIEPGPVYKKCECKYNSYKTYDVNSYSPNKQYRVCSKKEELPYWFVSYLTLFSMFILLLFILPIAILFCLYCNKLAA